MLLAQRSMGLPPLGAPPERFDAEQVRAWNDVVSAAPSPDIFRVTDRICVAVVATILANWRAGYREPGRLHEVYRWLGLCFIPMRERRRLLFPERPASRSRLI
jgi:hypothetical protein